MCQTTPNLTRLERLTGLPVQNASTRLLRALGLDALESALAQSASQVSTRVQRKLERICGVSLPPARRRHLYRGLGIEELEARLLLTAITWDGGGKTNNWSDAANWSTDTIPTSADDVIFNSSSLKDSIVDSAFRGTINSINIDGTFSGSISLLTGLNVRGGWTQAGGTFDAGSSTLRVSNVTDISGGAFIASSTATTFLGSLTISGAKFDANAGTVVFQGGDKTVDANGVAFHNVTFNLGSGGDLSVVGTLDVDGDLLIQGATNSTLKTGTVTVAGNLTTTNIGFRGAGEILLDGASDQILSAGGSAGQLENLTIQKSGGTLFLQDTLEIYGNLTHISGNVDAGTSTVEFQGGDKTVDANGIAFHNVTFNLGSGGDLSVVGTLDVDGDLLIKGATNSTLKTGVVTVAGDLTTTNIGFRGAGLIVMDGLGDQVLSANGGTGQLENLTIQKSGGTLYLQDTIEIYGNLTHISGDVDAGTSTIEFQGGDKTVDANGVAFHNVTFNLGFGGDLSVIGTLDVNGDLLIKGATNSTLKTGTVTVAGDFTNQNAGFRGNGLIELDGSGDQILTFNAGYRGDLTIAKSGGTARLATDLVLSGSGTDLRIVSGDLDRSGYAVKVGGLVDIAGGTFVGGGTITGDLSISNGGMICLNLAGMNSGEYEQLVVTGQLILGGDSHLVLKLSGIAAAGTVLDVIHYGSRTGEFTNLDFQNVPSSLDVDVQYDSVPGSMDVVVSKTNSGGGNSGGGNSGGGNSGGGNSGGGNSGNPGGGGGGNTGGGNSDHSGPSQFPIYSWNRFTNIRFPRFGTLVAQTTDAHKFSRAGETGWKRTQEPRPEFDPLELRDYRGDDENSRLFHRLELDQEKLEKPFSDDSSTPDERHERKSKSVIDEQTSNESDSGDDSSTQAKQAKDDTQENTTVEQRVSARLDAIDKLFTDFEWDELNRGENDPAPSDSTESNAGNSVESSDAPLVEAAAMAAIAGTVLTKGPSSLDRSAAQDKQGRRSLLSRAED